MMILAVKQIVAVVLLGLSFGHATPPEPGTAKASTPIYAKETA